MKYTAVICNLRNDKILVWKDPKVADHNRKPTKTEYPSNKNSDDVDDDDSEHSISSSLQN
jgi:hypothetical protein